MAVELRIAGNVLGVGCVPSRRSDRCTWSGRTLDRDGKRAWCQVRPARRRVHGWATPTRSRPEQCIPAAQLIRSGARCSCGDGLLPAVVFAATWLHVGERRPARASQRQAVKRSPGTRHEVVAAGRESRGTPKRWPSRSALPIGLHRQMSALYTMCANYSRAPRRRVASSHIAIRLCPLADPMCVSPPCTAPSRRLCTHRSTLAPTCRPDVRVPTHVSTPKLSASHS